MEIATEKSSFFPVNRTKAHELEESLLKHSGLVLYEQLHIFDVKIDFGGENYIHTTRCGDSNKENLILLHGYGGSGVLYFKALKHLAVGYKTFCLDLLGMGLSSRPKFSCSTPEEAIEFFVESLECWRIAMGIEEFYLGGHSFGGYVACHYAHKYGNRVKSLFLNSPLGVTKPMDDKPIEDFQKKMGFF
jgi:pimeloyl-ACP methyl ester carboxylesterase